MGKFSLYGFVLVVTASAVALLSMSTDFFEHWVNDIVIPCQHDSVWTGESCNCDNTRGIFAGVYCDECQCEHQGVCALSTKGGSSRWGCKCPSLKKWTGTLCDKCYAENHDESKNECSGPCKNSSKHAHFGLKCDTVCIPEGNSYDPVCIEISSGGGVCNACNGHGHCGPTGGCECDEGWFTTLGGEQCALSCETAGITCQEGKGVCQSLGGELQCVCEPGFYGKNCEDSCKSTNDLPCSGHGTCGLTSLGAPTCTCDTHYIGSMCQYECPGDKTFPTTCSGHGRCDLETNDDGTEQAVCLCNKDSAWVGVDCSCNSKYTCSGHGVCQDDATCECNDWDDPSPQHWSGAGCQTCKENWYGQECHLHCDPGGTYTPDEFAPDRNVPTDGVHIGCNGHGTCDVVPTPFGQRVQCSCRGTDPNWFCARCEANYYPLTNVAEASAYCTTECNEGTCSFHGRCNENYNGNNDICVCDTIQVGTTEFDTLDPAQYCAGCKQNWFPDQLESDAPCTHYCAEDGEIEGRIIVFGDNKDLNGDTNAQKVCSKHEDGWSPDPDCRVCNGHGACRNDGECECDSARTGKYCEIDCKADENGQVCSGHGRCVRNDLDMWFDPLSDDFRCECMPYDDYTAESRQRLIKRGFAVEPPPTPNFYGRHCQFHCPRYNEDICAGKGSCTTGITIPESSDSADGIEGVQPVQCTQDEDCKSMPGAFCARLASPWDSQSHGENSFFTDGPDSPGFFTCASSRQCIDAIYSVPWDDYCVNLLSSWYPNVLNTAECAYKDDGTNCREKVENFFMNPYKDTNMTWCQSALKEMAPLDFDNPDSQAKCTKNTHASERIFNIHQDMCLTYSLQPACNANPECIYDQTSTYITASDNYCAGLQIIDGQCCVGKDECPSLCEPNIDASGCESKTYCRARNCEDALIENNIESLCVSVEPACKGSTKDWADFCTETSGKLRNVSELSVKDTFFTCVMYENSANPQQVSARIPGDIDIYGDIVLAPEESVAIQQIRSDFINSRTSLDTRNIAENECSFGLASINFTEHGFCENHLAFVTPSWHTHQSPNPDWFKEYMVICSSGIDGIYTDQATAEKRAAILNKDCVVEYKCKSRDGLNWQTPCQATDSQIQPAAWSLECLSSGTTELQSVDWTSFTDDVSDCTLREHTDVTRWGNTDWGITDIIGKYKNNCEIGMQASWIPKETPIPTICDMGACAEGHTCTLCTESEETLKLCTNGVICVADANVDCFEDSPCQNDGECYQTREFLASNKYLCEWEHPEPVLAYIDGVEFSAELTTRNILIVPDAQDASGVVVVAKNDTWSTMLEPKVFVENGLRIGWSALWHECDAKFCPATSKCVPNCTACGGHSTGTLCTAQAIPPKSTERILPDKAEPCGAYDAFNWYAYCHEHEEELGASLDTGAPGGLDTTWTGGNLLLAEKKLLVRQVERSLPSNATFSMTIDIEQSDMDASLSLTLNGEESVWHVDGYVSGTYPDYTERTMGMSGERLIEYIGPALGTVTLKAMFGKNIILSSIKLDGVEQIQSPEQVLSDERFNMVNYQNITNYKAWTFDEFGTSTVYRAKTETYAPSRQCNVTFENNTMSTQCDEDEGAASQPNIRGQRWPVAGAYQKRIHGWSKIQTTSKQVANMDVFNGDFSSIVSTYIFQNKLYVNGAPTECRVEAGQWWHWTIDMHAIDEKHFVSEQTIDINDYVEAVSGLTLFNQTWDITVGIDDCSFSTQHTLVTTTLEKTTPAKMAASFHNIAQTEEHECRTHCHTHEECKQWAWTPEDKHCFLHASRCHEGGCTLGAHAMRSFHAQEVAYFEIWSNSLKTLASWNRIRAEDIIEPPSVVCDAVDTEQIPEPWREQFGRLYRPIHVDATHVCNSISSMWESLPGYQTSVCSGQDCGYDRNDLEGCAGYMNHAKPTIDIAKECEDEKQLFLDLDWTSYCRYERSFHGTKSFLGNRQVNVGDGKLADMCAHVETVREDAKKYCEEPIDTEWFGNCFERTSDYETFCSASCIEHIEEMLDDNPDDPSIGRSICKIRNDYLDIDVGSDCDCGLQNTDLIVTDFCMMQTAYHYQDTVNIPELYNSQCADECISTLQQSMNRSDWRTWCKSLSENKIPGTCSKTVCECDTETYNGVAGQRCELNCPTGTDNGRELACSGRNGRCFAIDETQIIEDRETQTLNNEFRNESYAGAYMPVWQRGPEPYADGRCQCALGSGMSCSIPCDRCNNGTYGHNAASQYGICDSFNGICRGLAPWMRYDFDHAEKEELSINTTLYETGLGFPKWKYADRFLYESDTSTVEHSIMYMHDNQGYLQPSIAEPTLEERTTIESTLYAFSNLCWNESTTNMDYLDNQKSITLRGLSIVAGEYPLKTTEIEASELCTVVEYDADLTLCYSEGRFHARDGYQPLKVIESGNAEVTFSNDNYLRGMSFTKHRDGHLYAFGGMWEYGDRDSDTNLQQKMDDMYKIQVRRVSWEPYDIVVVHWYKLTTFGQAPAAQIHAPLVAFEEELYLLSKYNPAEPEQQQYQLYKLLLPTPITPTASWSVVERDVPIIGLAKNMRKNAVGQLEMDFISGSLLYTPSSEQNRFLDRPSFNMTTLHVLTEKFDGAEQPCVLKFEQIGSASILSISGQRLLSTTNNVKRIDIYLQEWNRIDTDTDASIVDRFLETVALPERASTDASTLTQYSKLGAMDMVERVHMHQGRWTASDMMFVKSQMSPRIWPDNAMYEYVDIQQSDFTPEFEDVFDFLSLNYFTAEISSTPSLLNVHVEGVTPDRKLIIQGNFVEEQSAYTQRFFVGSKMMELYLEWTETTLQLRLSKSGDRGFVRWFYSRAPCRTFLITVALEDWLRGAVDVRQKGTYTQEYSDRTGREAMFSLFVAREVSFTWSMMKQTSDFLAYTSSHCSETASEQCPGFLPYIQLPCSGRGRCSISCQCTCEVAPSVLQTSKNALVIVDPNDSPFRGAGCERTCPGYDGFDKASICSGHGKCLFDGSCACSPPYTGPACQFQCPQSEDGSICSGHGACSETGYETSSFVFTDDDYLDTITARNKKNYIMALSSFYSPCKFENYIPQDATYTSIMEVANGDFDNLEFAIDKCESINLAIRQNARLNRDEEFRDYPYDMCIGIIEDLPKYQVATLIKPHWTTIHMHSTILFDCEPSECSFDPDPINDNSIRGLRTRLMAPSYEIKLVYVHGASSGTEIYKVNDQRFEISTIWTPNTFQVTFGNGEVGRDTVTFNEPITIFKLVVEGGKARYKVFRDYFPQASDTKKLYMAPLFEEKYVKQIENIDDGYIVNENNPYLNWKVVEYACDLQPLCLGIVQWETPHKETLYSMYFKTNALDSKELQVFDMPAEAHIYFKKMSLVYQGRDVETSKCNVISDKLSKFPSALWTQVYDIPLENIDLSLAKDEDVPQAVVIGNGLWTRCWEKVDAVSKQDCYLKAKERGVYGFAYSEDKDSEDKHVCIVYKELKDPSKIKLGKYNSEGRLSLFQPCENSDTKWKPFS